MRWTTRNDDDHHGDDANDEDDDDDERRELHYLASEPAVPACWLWGIGSDRSR